MKKVVIMGAAGRHFHNFNTYFRDNPNFQVVAFTATQIPDIEGRRYPAVLAGKLYTEHGFGGRFLLAVSRNGCKPPRACSEFPAPRRPGYFFVPSHSLEPARAIVFVDGPNLYHAVKSAGLRANRIDPYKVAKKLVEFRTLVEVRYDIAEIDRAAPARRFRAHRDLLALLEPHPDVRLCRGHMRRVQASNPCVRELARYLGNLTLRLPRDAYHELMDIASRHSAVTVHRS